MKLKICGVKTVKEAEGLKAAGVDYVGLNFVPASSRCISLETAQDIIAVLKDSPIETVALFQNQPLDMVEEYVRELAVDYVQLHGNESAEYARAVQASVIRAIAVKPTDTAETLNKFMENYPAEYFVLDREKQGKGNIVDLGLAAKVIAAAPNKVCLAGGIDADNLIGILSKVQPYAIDISSGVRTGDSIDMALVAQCQKLIAAARSNRP